MQEKLPERARLEQAMVEIRTRLEDLKGREAVVKELEAFLRARPILTRSDVIHASQVLPSLRPRKGEMGAARTTAARTTAMMAEGATVSERQISREINKGRPKGPFGTALAAWRMKQELSIEELAQKLDVHYATVYAWERGSNLPTQERRAEVMMLTGFT
jgi:DNA-binding transcriptional regulator YiaG